MMVSARRQSGCRRASAARSRQRATRISSRSKCRNGWPQTKGLSDGKDLQILAKLDHRLADHWRRLCVGRDIWVGKMSDKKFIVVDLDGTVCDCAHRVHLAQAKQWDEFHAGIPHDKPHPDAVEFLSAMAAHYDVLLCT